ncbi:type I-U CRISPR-associated protein Csb2 [Candidatus Poriferisodalis sp.]|uniref:type I-G CRISPR-associated protein Csb2 n=1 Tax=Candidatus Poriferisodalis sp. TaxID=3101277 RepID=UPI003B019D55
MLSVTVEFLHGTFRADPDGTAHTGRLEHGEWPPSPSRLFAAFVAADGTRDRCRHTSGAELSVFVGAPPPVIRASTASEVHHQRLQPRFIVKQEGKAHGGTQQEYVGRIAVEVRPGVRVSARHPRVQYCWPIEVGEDDFRALQVRAARIGYLGCADSPVRVRVTDADAEARLVPTTAFEPDPSGEVAISVPAAGHLEALDAAFDEWTAEGGSVGRSQFPALINKERYRSPGAASTPSAKGGVAVTMVLRPAVSARRISQVTATFKAAVLKHYQAVHGEPLPELHGHGFGSTGYDTARYLALPDVGHAHAKGRIHGVALWLPATAPDGLAAAVRAAAARIARLDGTGINVGVEMWDGQRRPGSVRPSRWSGPAQHWVSVFPAIHERHRQVTLAEVSRWCANAGLPAPVAVRNSRSPLIAGAARLASVEVHRQGRPKRPFSHFELWFDEPISGPVVIGSGRQRGFGLCLPLGPPTAAQPRSHRG